MEFLPDLKVFFDFANKVINYWLEPRNYNEKALKQFSDGTFPMDMSAEQKCFNLGGGRKIKEFSVLNALVLPTGICHFLIRIRSINVNTNVVLMTNADTLKLTIKRRLIIKESSWSV